MEWTSTQIEELRRLWAEGHSMAAIGEKMGCTKNAVAGKRNRLGLSAAALRPRGIYA
jgi:GcrA cell cycle regulator